MSQLPIRSPVRILGIDPGLRRTGWGVVEIDGNRLSFVGCGSVEPPDNLPLARRLLAIHEGLAKVLGDYRPAEAAVEQTFVNKDGVATLKLGQARGVAMLAPAMAGIAVSEYAPNQVKKTVVGAGHAEDGVDQADGVRPGFGCGEGDVGDAGDVGSELGEDGGLRCRANGGDKL